VDSLLLTGDQVLSLWSGSTDSKTLDYQRTNPKEYQIVRTHSKEITWIQDPASSNHPRQDTSSKQQTKIQTQSSADRITTSLSLAHQRKNKQTNNNNNKKKNSVQISTYMKLSQTTGPTLGVQKQKGRKDSALKLGKRKRQTQ